VGFVANNRFSEFSIIYQFIVSGKVINPVPTGLAVIERGLRESVVAYFESGNYFKVLKRLFSLARIHGDKATLDALTPILNSDLGRLYYIISDCDVLLFLLDKAKAPGPPIKYEVDYFIHRLANISLPAVAQNPALNKQLHRIAKSPLDKMATPLEKFRDQLDDILQKSAKPVLDTHHKNS
jgi:hypothetical protein